MISIATIFWIFIFFFCLIGALRGWAKEIVATAGLVLSIFTLRLFGWDLVNLLGMASDNTSALSDVFLRRQFWILTGVHLFIAFFSYQGPTLAGSVGSRLRPRDTVQDKLLGGIIGAINGYLIIGTILSFLEFRVNSADGFERLDGSFGYPFDAATIMRPSNWAEIGVFQYLPLDLLSGPVLPLIMVVLFLIVLIAII